MKLLIRLTCYILLLSIFISCTNQKTAFNPDFEIGIIETTQKENKSLIHFYDQYLNK